MQVARATTRNHPIAVSSMRHDRTTSRANQSSDTHVRSLSLPGQRQKSLSAKIRSVLPISVVQAQLNPTMVLAAISKPEPQFLMRDSEFRETVVGSVNFPR